MKKHHIIIIALLLLTCGALTARAQQAPKAAYALLIDNTGSLRTQLSFQKNLGKEIVRSTANRMEFCVYQFQTSKASRGSIAEVVPNDDCSLDEQSLLSSLGRIQTVPGQTGLIDAVKYATASLDARLRTEPAKDIQRIVI